MRVLFFIGLLFISLSLTLTAQEKPAYLPDELPDNLQVDDTLVSNMDLFEGESPIDMILRFDLKQYQRTKNKGEYQDVDLQLVVNDTIEVKKVVRIKARGNFRRSFCSIAPFWLNIRKADLANVHLQETKKMKVVTQCRQSSGNESYVLKEYLSYKMYQLLSPYSFRVRLIRITYIDTGRKDKETQNWAFLIEPEDMMADRTGAIPIKNDRLAMAHMRKRDMLRVAMFQYLIGNGDYSITGRHNVKLLGVGDFGISGMTPVPYDFDYTGFVDADYAIPGDHLGIEEITDRYYLGPCATDGEYQQAMDELSALRDAFRELILDFPYLTDKDREEVYDYVEEYYVAAEKSWFIERSLRATCR